LHVVVYGGIKLSMHGRGSAEHVVDILGAGRSFGEPIMFLRKPYVVSASATCDTLVLQVPREAVFAEIERNPGFARRVIETLSERAEGLVQQLETQAAGSAADRLVAWLLRRSASAHGESRVRLPGSKTALASQLNLSAEHLSRVLRELSDRGLLEVRGRELLVRDLPRLREWSARKEPLHPPTSPVAQ
jgi:CRP/FNR family transcriptional regulator, dissimilatory nitrate respiration regulator